METNTSKIFTQFTAGSFGGTLLGIAGFSTMMNYGGNGGCLAFIDALFSTAGYESCGSFGSIFGLIVGAIIGIAVLSKVKIQRYSKVAAWLLIGAFVLPFLYGAIVFWPPFEDDDLLIVPPVIIGFMIASIIPSAVIIGAIHCRNIFRKKQ